MIAEKQAKTDLGKIKIHTDAINSMALIAAKEVEGVAGVTSGTMGRFCDFLGLGSNCSGVKVELKENNEVDIVVSIVVEYGKDVPRIAHQVQENIRQAIEKMTGLIPANIDVKVKGIEKTK